MSDRAAVSWLHVIRRYVVFLAAGNLVWEFLHMPLYTLWSEGSPRQIVLSGLHCVGGDVLIGVSAMVAALLIAGSNDWPEKRFQMVAGITLVLGLGYTVFSEWYNVYVAESWTYAPAMPRIFGVGMSPLAQWIVIPGLAFWWSGQRSQSSRRAD